MKAALGSPEAFSLRGEVSITLGWLKFRLNPHRHAGVLLVSLLQPHRNSTLFSSIFANGQ